MCSGIHYKASIFFLFFWRTNIKLQWFKTIRDLYLRFKYNNQVIQIFWIIFYIHLLKKRSKQPYRTCPVIGCWDRCSRDLDKWPEGLIMGDYTLVCCVPAVASFKTKPVFMFVCVRVCIHLLGCACVLGPSLSSYWCLEQTKWAIICTHPSRCPSEFPVA